MVQILLLEDYPPLRQILALTLRRAGFQVLVTQSVCAVQQAQEQHVGDVLLVDADHVTPENWRVLHALALAHPPLPIVALLSPENAELLASESVGVQILLLKPVRRAALLQSITGAVHGGGGLPSEERITSSSLLYHMPSPNVSE